MTPFESYQSTRRFGSLDGIRCCSILAVILYHTWNGNPNVPMTQRGFLGVDMFFVLSGFLIVTLLLREKAISGAISIRKFYARRALRIFPPYYFLLLVLTVVYSTVSARGPLAKPFFEALPYNLTYTSNWIVMDGLIRILWSLATEEQFYLVWPFVQKWLRGPAVYALLTVLILLNQLMNYRIIDPWFRSVFGVGYDDLNILQSTFTPILLGALLANLLHTPRGFAAIHRVCGSGMSAPWLLLLIALMNVPAEDIGGTLRLSTQVTMMFLLAACVVREQHPLRRLLTLRPAVRMGVISYGMYLYHTLGHHVAGAVLKRFGVVDAEVNAPLPNFLICLAVTYLIAEASFRLLETPFLRWKGRYATK